MQTRAERMKAVNDKIATVKALALQKYGINLSDLVVKYDLKGRTAGWAIGMRTIRLNTTAIFGDEEHFKDMVDDTIPHEIAHIVCHRNPTLGRKHDYGWASVCRALGGTGKRTHDMTTIEYARGRTYIYTSSMGKEYAVSEQRHRKIQMGATLRFRKASWGTLDKHCAYTVKFNGRVISTQPATQRPTVSDMAWGVLHDLAARVVPTVNPTVSSFVVPSTQAAEKPTAPKPVQTVANTGSSKASQVRYWIRAAKAQGDGQEWVINMAQTQLGMARSQAYRYVTENWNRA